MKRSPWIMAGLAIAEASFVHAPIEHARAQSPQYWYYCDPAHAYYPYVNTCSVPWREVTPNPSVSPPTQSATTLHTPSANATAVASPFEPQPPAAYRQGQVDRQSWEAWFASLTDDTRAGADYWAAHRSVPNPGSCDAVPPSTGADWTAGCLAAQQKLAASDVRRKTEPQYRQGWNNPPLIGSPPTSAASSGSSTPRPEALPPEASTIGNGGSCCRKRLAVEWTDLRTMRAPRGIMRRRQRKSSLA